MALPLFQTALRELSMMQSQWKSQLDPLLALPTNNTSILRNITLITGNNVIYHKLNQTPIGWVIIDQDANIGIYRSQPFNDKTLTLNSSGAANISLMVF